MERADLHHEQTDGRRTPRDTATLLASIRGRWIDCASCRTRSACHVDRRGDLVCATCLAEHRARPGGTSLTAARAALARVTR